MLPSLRLSFIFSLGVLGLIAVPLAARQQVPPPPAPTTGAISGVVIDGATGKPIGGASVSFWSFDSQDPRSYQQSMLTDPKGRFVFLRLPRTDGCNVYASRSGYASGAVGLDAGFGAVAMALKEGEWVPNVTLTLWRNGGISGRVVDELNEPVVGIPVRALRVIFAAGVPHVAAGPIGTTDDRGMYRIASLRPGKYLVMVPSVQSSAPASSSPLTLAGRSSDAATDGRPPINDLGLNIGGDRLVIGNYVTPPPATDRVMVYPTVFYPGARVLTSATPIDLAPGEEKGGVDVALQPVPAVRVSGTVISAGPLDPNFVLRLVPRGSEDLGVGSEQATALVSASGAFTFLGVPSGSYTLDAGSNVTRLGGSVWGPPTPGMLHTVFGFAPAPSVSDGAGLVMQRKDVIEREWVELPIDVGADDLSGVRITLRPSVNVSGEIVWDGPPGQLPSVLIEPADGEPWLYPTRTTLGGPLATRQFSMTGLRAGEYVIRPTYYGADAFSTAPSATVVRIVANGQDVTTRTIDTTSGDISGVVVTMTTRATRISGSVRDVTEPGRQTSVIAFPVEKRQWSRYGFTPLTIKAASFAGPRYTLTGLPPGEYFVVAVDAASGGAWRDPAWLEAASRVATRVTLKWDEPVTIDLPLSRVQVK
ncbi:MAG TPA: carboxypeptidase-like regulatory domain-containing protein [Vicinamibacterales bacterium]|nr:carboxypeptidase-like regulatory domain-containing protein [Vicinamibacterales bacterium]